MFCMSCGTKLPDDAAFCYKCGTKINSSAIESAGKSPLPPGGGLKLLDNSIENYLTRLQQNYPQPVSKDRIKKVQYAILDSIANALEAGQLHTPDVPVISSYVLKEMEGISKEWELVYFFDNFSMRWEVFKGLKEQFILG